jgi:micrococcal nuclease
MFYRKHGRADRPMQSGPAYLAGTQNVCRDAAAAKPPITKSCANSPADSAFNARYSLKMPYRFFLFVFLFLVPLATVARDTIPLPPGLKAAGSAVAVEVIDGDTVVLDTGREVRLVGLQAPKLPLGRKGFRKWPLADESKAALERLTLRRRLTLNHGGREVDRHRRLLAHLAEAETGQWIQGTMLSLGMARVYTFKDNRSAVADMLALERAARAAKRGIWGHRYYAVRTPETVKRDIGSFQIVEGTVFSVAERKNTTFLNFDRNWREDFTVVIRGRDRRAFETAGVKLKALEGRRIRVRGWVKSWNGPSIDATHPEQVELLGSGG